MVILVDLSAIFLASPLSILAWELKQMAWLSKLAQSFLDLLLSCLSQTKTSQNHNEYRMLSSFARTLPSKLHQLLVWIQKTLITQSLLY